MREDYPAHVSRFLHALTKHALVLMTEERKNLAIERSINLIKSPWEHQPSAIPETRQTVFLRDFFNVFHECLQSCETLDVIKALTQQTLDQQQIDASAVVTFWGETYLNEVYIFQLRVLDLLTFVERKYKKDEDFKEFITSICAQLRAAVTNFFSSFLELRGAHVHRRRDRHSNPELARLSALFVCISALGMEELEPERERSIAEAKQWLLEQIAHFGDQCWLILNDVCRALAEDGIVTDNGWMIVPLPYKDDPKPLLALRGAQSEPQEPTSAE